MQHLARLWQVVRVIESAYESPIGAVRPIISRVVVRNQRVERCKGHEARPGEREAEGKAVLEPVPQRYLEAVVVGPAAEVMLVDIAETRVVRPLKSGRQVRR